MQRDEHPARRPTRYHWAAGTHPWHWGGALVGWAATLAAGFGSYGSEWLGWVAPWLAMASLGWSGLWLLVVPNDPRFKRAIDAQNEARFENDFDYQREVLRERIDRDEWDKVDDITHLRNRAREILTHKFGEHDLFARDNLEKLDKLAISHLQLLAALSEYDEYLSLVDPDKIEQELETAQNMVDAQEGALREARQRHVELLTNRLVRYKKASQRLKVLGVQCRNVETTLKLLIDQAMTAPDAERVGKDIDQVLMNIRDSEILTEELSIYDDLERELDDSRMAELE
jgi:hypothetical protein